MRCASAGVPTVIMRHTSWRVDRDRDRRGARDQVTARTPSRRSPRRRRCAPRGRRPTTSSPERRRPVMSQSSASGCRPGGGEARRRASGTMPEPGISSRTFALGATNRASIGSVIEAPTPIAWPFAAAITGFVHSKMRRVTTPPGSRPLRWPPENVFSPEPRSAPTQNARPDPVTTTARTSGSASMRMNSGAQVTLRRVRERVEPVGAVQGDCARRHRCRGRRR